MYIDRHEASRGQRYLFTAWLAVSDVFLAGPYKFTIHAYFFKLIMDTRSACYILPMFLPAIRS